MRTETNKKTIQCCGFVFVCLSRFVFVKTFFGMEKIGAHYGKILFQAGFFILTLYQMNLI